MYNCFFTKGEILVLSSNRRVIFVLIALQHPLLIHLFTSALDLGLQKSAYKPCLKPQDLAKEAMEMLVVIFAGLPQRAHRVTLPLGELIDK